jgi:glyoxylase-like metal-dependent hydrolase (beta-lactamase superfamily II)
MRLLDNLYAYVWRGSDNNCNSYVFAGALEGGGHVLVDPGHIVTPFYREPGLERLLQSMARDGIAADGVGLVILTHGHPDHCEAAVALQETCRTLVAVHEADEDLFRDLGGKVDIYLEEGALNLGRDVALSLEILHSPGHTPGHVTVYWPGRKVLIAGDCVFYRSTGRTDFPGGSARSLMKSIETLSKLDIEYLLCGHPYGNPGIIRGREKVRDNFAYIMNFFGESAL